MIGLSGLTCPTQAVLWLLNGLAGSHYAPGAVGANVVAVGWNFGASRHVALRKRRGTLPGRFAGSS